MLCDVSFTTAVKYVNDASIMETIFIIASLARDPRIFSAVCRRVLIYPRHSIKSLGSILNLLYVRQKYRLILFTL